MSTSRDKIIQAAMELFWLKGFNSTSIADLLSRTQLNSGSLYHVFPSKQDVLIGVLEDMGGYGDHMRFHTEGECRNLFSKQMDYVYTMPYEEAKGELDERMAKVEEEMNEKVDYGDELPFPDVQFPFRPA